MAKTLSPFRSWRSFKSELSTKLTNDKLATVHVCLFKISHFVQRGMAWIKFTRRGEARGSGPITPTSPFQCSHMLIGKTRTLRTFYCWFESGWECHLSIGAWYMWLCLGLQIPRILFNSGCSCHWASSQYWHRVQSAKLC